MKPVRLGDGVWLGVQYDWCMPRWDNDFVTLNSQRTGIESAKEALNFRKVSLWWIKNYPWPRVRSRRDKACSGRAGLGQQKNFQPQVGSDHEKGDPCRTLLPGLPFIIEWLPMIVSDYRRLSIIANDCQRLSAIVNDFQSRQSLAIIGNQWQSLIIIDNH